MTQLAKANILPACWNKPRTEINQLAMSLYNTALSFLTFAAVFLLLLIILFLLYTVQLATLYMHYDTVESQIYNLQVYGSMLHL